MEATKRQQELKSRLESFGDPRKTYTWPKRDPDYVALLQLTHADAPQLLAEIRQWVDREDWPDDQDDLTIYAPIHAWRAAAQLGVAEAVEVLLGMLDDLNERGDDWYLEEFPDAFALIGPSAIDKVLACVTNDEREDMVRICAANGLQQIAVHHPDHRSLVVEALAGQLSRYAINSDEYNAFMAHFLVGLDAKEAAEVIERAFAADRIDITIIGNWNCVRDELGVQGMGIVSPDLASASRPFWTPEIHTRPRRESSERLGGGTKARTGRYKRKKRRSR